MLNQRYLKLILILLLLLNKVSGRKKFKTLLWQDIKGTYNKRYSNNYTTKINENRLSIDMELFVKRDLPKQIWMQLGILLSEDKADKYRSIFAYNVNVCSLLSNDLKLFNILHIWMNNLLKYSNMPRECPWKQGLYYWRKFQPIKNSIPDFMLSGIYRIDAKFYFPDANNDWLTNTSLLVQIKMK